MRRSDEPCLKDIQYDLDVTLSYQIFPRHDVIRKKAEIRNNTRQVITVKSAQSGVWYVPPGDGYRLSQTPPAKRVA